MHAFSSFLLYNVNETCSLEVFLGKTRPEEFKLMCVEAKLMNFCTKQAFIVVS